MPESVAPENSSCIPDSRLFFVQLEASSAFRIRRERPIVVNSEMGDGRRVELTVATEYDEVNGLPRPIVLVSVTLTGKDLNEAVSWATSFTRSYLQCLAVATNAVVEDAKPLYAVDVSLRSPRREFFQSQSQIERQRIPSETRLIVDESAMAFAYTVINAPKLAHERVARAVQQYVLALRQWTLETKVLSVGHLFMAAEALTPVAKSSLGLSDDELFELEKIDSKLKYSKRKRDKPNAADARARRLVTFGGDSATLRGVKDLSDGLEHGYGDYEKLIRLADEHGEKALRHVRHAILKLSTLESPLLDRLLVPKYDYPLPLFGMFSVFGTVPEPSDVNQLRTPRVDMSIAAAENCGYDEATGSYKVNMVVKPTAIHSVGIEGYRFRP